MKKIYVLKDRNEEKKYKKTLWQKLNDMKLKIEGIRLNNNWSIKIRMTCGEQL